jgi:hypothetical protein
MLRAVSPRRAASGSTPLLIAIHKLTSDED